MLRVLGRDKHRLPIGGVGDRGFRHGQHGRRLRSIQPHADIHTRLQLPLRVRQGRLYLHKACCADHRIDRHHPRLEVLPTHRVHRQCQHLPGVHFGGGLLAQGEVHMQLADVGQADDGLASGQVLALMHTADAELAGERSTNGLLRNQRLDMLQLTTGHVHGRGGVVQQLLRHGIHRAQFAAALQHHVSVTQPGLQLHAQGLLGCVVELHQQLPGRDCLPRLEGDAGNTPWHLGRHLHLVDRLQLPRSKALPRQLHLLGRGQRHLGRRPHRRSGRRRAASHQRIGSGQRTGNSASPGQ